MRHRFLEWLVLLALGWTSPGWAAGSMRCGSQIIAEGASAASVLVACGEPEYRDTWAPPPYDGSYALAREEEWYYNFGPNLLLRVLRLRDGQVVEIDADGYGFSEPPHPPCDPSRIVEGLSKYRLVLMCGAPLTRRSLPMLVPYDRWGRRAYGFRGGYFVQVHREEWVYNFGSRRFMRMVILEDGRVVDVQDGDRGSD